MNTQVEQIAKTISQIVLMLGVISGIILIGKGLSNTGLLGDKALVIVYVTAGVIDILTAIIFWVFVNLLVNISMKLDDKQMSYVAISQTSLNELANILTAKKDQKMVDVKPKAKPKVDDKPHISTQKTINDSYAASQKIEQADEVENMVLGEVLSNNMQSARLILMTKKGMSLDQAIAYIENLKSGIK